MALQVPEVKVNQAPGPQSIGRLDAPIPNGVADMSSNIAGITEVGKEVIKYKKQVENQTADTIGTNAENQLEQKFKSGMYGDPEKGVIGLKFKEGNPTELYKNFDQDMQKHIEELSTGEGWSQETQTVVNRRLNKKAEQLQLQLLTEYGNQQKKYDDDVTKSGVGLNQQAMPDATTYVQPGKPDTFSPLQNRMNSIRDLRIAQAVRYGGAVENPDGMTSYTAADGTIKKVDLTPTVQLQIKKDLSDGLFNSIDNLIKSNSLDKAKAVKDQFGDYLDPVKSAKLEAEMNKTGKTNEAFELADKIRKTGADPSSALQNTDPKVRHETLKIINEDQRAQEAIAQRKSKKNADFLSNYISQKMRSDNPFNGSVEMENDPVVIHALDKVTDAKQKAALYHMVEQPKDTSPAAQNKIQKLFFGQDPNGADVRSMSPEDFNQYLSGLSKADRRHYESKFEAMKTQTGPQMQQQYKTFGAEFDRQAVGAGLLNKNQYGKFAGDDEVKEIHLRKELLDSIDRLGPMTPKETSDYVGKFVADKKSGQVFVPPVRPKFQGSAQPPAGASTPPPKNDVANFIGNLSDATKLQYMQDYKKQNNVMPNASQLADFIKSRTKAK